MCSQKFEIFPFFRIRTCLNLVLESAHPVAPVSQYRATARAVINGVAESMRAAWVKRRCSAEISKSYIRQSGRPCSPFADTTTTERGCVKAVLQVKRCRGTNREEGGKGEEGRCFRWSGAIVDKRHKRAVLSSRPVFSGLCGSYLKRGWKKKRFVSTSSVLISWLTNGTKQLTRSVGDAHVYVRYTCGSTVGNNLRHITFVESFYRLIAARCVSRWCYTR